MERSSTRQPDRVFDEFLLYAIHAPNTLMRYKMRHKARAFAIDID